MSPRSGPLAAAAGAALASSGIMGTLLAGTSAADAATVTEAGQAAVTAAAKVCGQPPAAAKTKAVRSGVTAVTLDAATVFQATPKPTTSASQTTATPDATASATSTASVSASPSASASSTPSTNPTAAATSTPSPSPSASSSTSASPSPSPSPSPSATKSASPSPSPTKTVTLCLEVQPLSSSGVKAGSKAGYAIWVWPAGGAATSVSVTISAKVAARSATPAFTVCPSTSKLTCTVGGISTGTSDELQATVPVPAKTSAGRDAILSVTAKAGDTAAPPAVTGTVSVTTTASPSGSATPSPGGTPSVNPAGVGATLPGGILPTVPGSVGAAAGLPELPSPQSSLGSLFPTVQPGSSASPTPSLPNARNVKVADAAATFPFSTRLIGGEIAGLAVLAAALAIGIVRFSLRRPRPQHGKDPGS
jgi:hypothetical protein